MSVPGGTGDAGFDLDVAIASLIANSDDVRVLLKVMVKQLGAALGDRLSVERKGGVLHRSDELRSVEVAIGDDTYRGEVHGTGLACSVVHSSGGIRIRSEKVEADEWLRRLLGSLQAEAAHSLATRQALEQIVIGGSL